MKRFEDYFSEEEKLLSSGGGFTGHMTSMLNDIAEAIERLEKRVEEHTHKMNLPTNPLGIVRSHDTQPPTQPIV